mmetsp:Transcript_100195/g.269107  ORF Transcript_100195/g.269107 Transcript_100195/m.269107 type:complete len:289 (+) Transcript_100195:234-1100(+)
MGDVLWAINDDFAFSLQKYDFGRPLDHDVRSETVLGMLLPMRHLLEGLARALAAPQRLIFCQSPPALRAQEEVPQASVAKLVLYVLEPQLEELGKASGESEQRRTCGRLLCIILSPVDSCLRNCSPSLGGNMATTSARGFQGVSSTSPGHRRQLPMEIQSTMLCESTSSTHCAEATRPTPVDVSVSKSKRMRPMARFGRFSNMVRLNPPGSRLIDPLSLYGRRRPLPPTVVLSKKPSHPLESWISISSLFLSCRYDPGTADSLEKRSSVTSRMTRAWSLSTMSCGQTK